MTETKLADNKYGNEFFNRMMAGIELWPETTLVELKYRNDQIEIVEIPTVDIWVIGDWLARRYAATPYSVIQKWLRNNGKPLYNVKTIGVVNCPKIRSA